MNGIEKVIDSIAAQAEKAARESGRAEHREADGLLHCDTCGEATQTRVNIFGEERTVRCICRCEIEEREKQERARQYERKLQRIERLRIQGFDKAEMQGWTFENDDGKQPKVMKAAKAYCERFETFKDQGKGLPLIVTTNVHAQKMMSETDLARQRIYSRVLERCHPIEVEGADRRTEQALNEYAEMNRLLGI